MTESESHFIGVDDGGYDGRTFCVCVAKRVVNGFDVVAHYYGRDRKVFEAQIKAYAEHYAVNEENIKYFK
jgi:hypothetical protein